MPRKAASLQNETPEKPRVKAILREWYLKPKHQNSYRVCLVGFNTVIDKAASNQEELCTAVVTQRLSRTVLKTKSGSLYQLQGHSSAQRMQELGYCKEIIDVFETGFPTWWKGLLEDDLIKRQMDLSSFLAKQPRKSARTSQNVRLSNTIAESGRAVNARNRMPAPVTSGNLMPVDIPVALPDHEQLNAPAMTSPPLVQPQQVTHKEPGFSKDTLANADDHVDEVHLVPHPPPTFHTATEKPAASSATLSVKSSVKQPETRNSRDFRRKNSRLAGRTAPALQSPEFLRPFLAAPARKEMTLNPVSAAKVAEPSPLVEQHRSKNFRSSRRNLSPGYEVVSAQFDEVVEPQSVEIPRPTRKKPSLRVAAPVQLAAGCKRAENSFEEPVPQRRISNRKRQKSPPVQMSSKPVAGVEPQSAEIPPPPNRTRLSICKNTAPIPAAPPRRNPSRKISMEPHRELASPEKLDVLRYALRERNLTINYNPAPLKIGSKKRKRFSRKNKTICQSSSIVDQKNDGRHLAGKKGLSTLTSGPNKRLKKILNDTEVVTQAECSTKNDRLSTKLSIVQTIKAPKQVQNLSEVVPKGRVTVPGSPLKPGRRSSRLRALTLISKNGEMKAPVINDKRSVKATIKNARTEKVTVSKKGRDKMMESTNVSKPGEVLVHAAATKRGAKEHRTVVGKTIKTKRSLEEAKQQREFSPEISEDAANAKAKHSRTTRKSAFESIAELQTPAAGKEVTPEHVSAFFSGATILGSPGILPEANWSMATLEEFGPETLKDATRLGARRPVNKLRFVRRRFSIGSQKKKLKTVIPKRVSFKPPKTPTPKPKRVTRKKGSLKKPLQKTKAKVLVRKSVLKRPSKVENSKNPLPDSQKKAEKRTLKWFTNTLQNVASRNGTMNTAAGVFLPGQTILTSPGILPEANWSIGSLEEFSPVTFTDTTRTFRMSIGKPQRTVSLWDEFEPSNAQSAAERLNHQGFLDHEKLKEVKRPRGAHHLAVPDSVWSSVSTTIPSFSIPSLPKALREDED